MTLKLELTLEDVEQERAILRLAERILRDSASELTLSIDRDVADRDELTDLRRRMLSTASSLAGLRVRWWTEQPVRSGRRS